MELIILMWWKLVRYCRSFGTRFTYVFNVDIFSAPQIFSAQPGKLIRRAAAVIPLLILDLNQSAGPPHSHALFRSLDIGCADLVAA